MLIVDFRQNTYSKKILENLNYRIFKDLDWSGRWETPMGVAGRVRPRRLAEEAQLTPHGKRAS
ncbi:hypothetical protein, partial [Gottfriedia luciferensis]|uniref:hypothetical protein n=1 Tax=Gottfriedia luciferensis TaxID=178774 RepID=UPI0038B348DB